MASFEEQEGIMEVPEIDGEVLVACLDASLTVEQVEEGRHAEFMIDGEGSSDQELNLIHPHQDCEDCWLDDILLDFEGCGCSRSPMYVVDAHVEWAEMGVTAGFVSDVGMEGWYMDGVMEWEEEMLDDGRNYPCYPYYSGEPCMEQAHGSPLWE